jgi:hypothetical protein
MNTLDFSYATFMVVAFFVGLAVISTYLNNHFK